MSELLGSLGGFFSGPTGAGIGKLAELGATGAGLFGNISANREQQQELNYLKQQQAQLGTPQQIAQQVAGATQPLNRGLVQAVENNVNGNLAEQGLAQAPGIQATVLSQALAPAEMQNQQQAMQIVMQRLGLPIDYANAMRGQIPPNTNMAPLLAMLFKNMGNLNGTQPTTSGNYNFSFPMPMPAPNPSSANYPAPAVPDFMNGLDYSNLGVSGGG